MTKGTPRLTKTPDQKKSTWNSVGKYGQAIGAAGTAASQRMDANNNLAQDDPDNPYNTKNTATEQGLTQAFGSNPITSAFMGIGKAGKSMGDKATPGGGHFFGPHHGVIGAIKNYENPMDVVKGATFIGAREQALKAEAWKEDQQRKADEYRISAESAMNRYQGSKFGDTQNMIAQAEYGIKANNTADVEIEKGEIVTDKNYNIKKISDGPTHENGGEDVTLSEGDVVFPTQDKNERNKVMSMIRRYKLNGKGKEGLDKMVEQLPEVNDTQMAEDGIKFTDHRIKPVDTGDYIPTEGYEKIYSEESDPYEYKEQDGEVYAKKKGNKNWKPINKEGKEEFEKRKEGGKYGGQSYRAEEVMEKPQGNTKMFEATKESNSNPYSFQAQNDYGISNTRTGDQTYDYGVEESPRSNEYKESKNKKNKSFGDIVGEVAEGIGKYSNVFHNLKRGNEDLAGLNRRQYDPEPFEYTDRSSRDRNAVLEAKRTGQLRGKGLSAGQQAGYNRALGNQFTTKMMDINQREARRADVIDQQNTQLLNRSALTNLELGNKYDTIERQQMAARDAYTDTAHSELASQQRFDARDRSMRERNRKQYAMDEATLPLKGTSDYNVEREYDDDGRYKFQTKYKWR